MSQLLPGAIIGIIGGDEQVASTLAKQEKWGTLCTATTNQTRRLFRWLNMKLSLLTKTVRRY